MKDARGHGSNARGGAEFDKALGSYAATHQNGIMSSVPSASGHELWALMQAHAQRFGESSGAGYSKSDILGMAGQEQGGAEIDYPERYDSLRRH